VKIVTLRDIENARKAADYSVREIREVERLRAEAERKRVFAEILSMDRRIGMLIREGKQVYYLNNPYREARDPRELN